MLAILARENCHTEDEICENLMSNQSEALLALHCMGIVDLLLMMAIIFIFVLFKGVWLVLSPALFWPGYWLILPVKVNELFSLSGTTPLGTSVTRCAIGSELTIARPNKWLAAV